MGKFFQTLGFVAVLSGVCAVLPAHAFDSADVLPQGIRSPAIRLGMITGIGEKYTSDGSLMTQNDFHSINFDQSALTRIEPRIQDLVKALDQFGHGQDLGSSLNLGTLQVHTDPMVQYTAPLIGYGVTEKFTVAVGVPIVKYTNQLSLSETGSNVSAIRKQVGGVSSTVDQAFNELNVSLVQSANDELAAKGYKPITNRDQTIFGDVNVAALYQFYRKFHWKLLSKTLFTLPTGPGADPDDLADLGLFGQTAIEQSVIANYQPLVRWNFSAKASYRYQFANQIVKRVPTSPDDTLPGPETKESVHEKIGDSIIAALGASYDFTHRFSVRGGYEITQKSADSYSGDRGSRYDLLSADTNALSHRVSIGGSYDTTQAYLRKEVKIPAMLAYEFSDTIRGVNVVRETINEFWITMFF